MLSKNLKNLLLDLLVIDYNKRIDSNDFFNHDWLKINKRIKEYKKEKALICQSPLMYNFQNNSNEYQQISFNKIKFIPKVIKKNKLILGSEVFEKYFNNDKIFYCNTLYNINNNDNNNINNNNINNNNINNNIINNNNNNYVSPIKDKIINI